MKIKGFHHVALICSDYEKSKHFYVDILEFSIIQETFRTDKQSYKLDLRISNGDLIELFSFPNPAVRVSYPEACGLRLMAFAVDNLKEFVASLKSKGVAVEEIRQDEITGQRFTFFKDPDNLPLEIYEI